MKNTVKLFVILLMLALLTVGLAVGVSADGEEITYDDRFNRVNIDKEALAGVVYIVYPNEAAFLADKADGTINGTGEGVTTSTDYMIRVNESYQLQIPSATSYYYLLGNIVLGQHNGVKNQSYVSIPYGNFNIVFNTAGHEVFAPQAPTGSNQGYATIYGDSWGKLTFKYGAFHYYDYNNRQNYTGRAAFNTVGTGFTLRFEEAFLDMNGGGIFRTDGRNQSKLEIYKCDSRDIGQYGLMYISNSDACKVTIVDSVIRFKSGNTFILADNGGKGVCDVYVSGSSTIEGSSGLVNYCSSYKSGLVFDVNGYFTGTVRYDNFVNSIQVVNPGNAGDNKTDVYFTDDDFTVSEQTKSATIWSDVNKTNKAIDLYCGTIPTVLFMTHLQGGGYIELYRDVVLAGNDGLSAGGDLTFNLNGKTLSRCTNKSFGGETENLKFFAATGKTLKFVGGNVVWNSASAMCMLNGANNQATIRFEDVNLTTDRGFLFDVRNGNVEFIGGAINYTNTNYENENDSVPFYFAEGTTANCPLNITVLGTDISGVSAVAYVTPHSSATGTVINSTLTIGKNGNDRCEIECYSFINFGAQTVNPDSTININVSDATVKNLGAVFGGERIKDTAGNDAKVTVNFSKVKLGNVAGMDVANVRRPQGEELLTLTGEEGLNYVIDTPAINVAAFKVNLSLYSHFVINVYVPTADSKVVAVDGVKLGEGAKIQKIDGIDYYAVSLSAIITPTTALESVSFQINFVDEDDGEGVVRVYNVTYAVYTYFRDYFETNNQINPGYILNKDAMVYIRAAYALAGQAGTEFDALIGEYESDFTFDTSKTEGITDDIVIGATFVIEDGNSVILRIRVSEDADVKVVAGGEEYTASNRYAGAKDVYLRAFALCDGFSVYANGALVGEYSLDAYYNRTVGVMNAQQAALVKALGAFAASAKAYKLSAN
jgi:hypothetical protein